MYDISSAIKAFNDMLKSLFDLLKTNKENQTDTDIITDKKSLKKATNIAEEIIQNREFNCLGVRVMLGYYGLPPKTAVCSVCQKTQKTKKIF